MSTLDDIKARAEGYTDGPWVIAADLPTWESEEGSFDVGPDDAPTVATVEGLANADLIAVAPKLLAALETVQKMATDVPRVPAFGGTKVSGILIADDILKTIEEALA